MIDQRRIELRIRYVKQQIATLEHKKSKLSEVAQIRRIEDEVLMWQGEVRGLKLWSREIDLDPASCEMAQEVVKAKTYCTEQDDGLSMSWSGCVFLNPPYGMPQIREFTDNAVDVSLVFRLYDSSTGHRFSPTLLRGPRRR